MRRDARVDAIQGEIVKALTEVGASVQSLAAIGRKVPDLLVGFRGENLILEVTDPSSRKKNGEYKAKYKYKEDQKFWRDMWAGQSTEVTSREEALAVIGIDLVKGASDGD